MVLQMWELKLEQLLLIFKSAHKGDRAVLQLKFSGKGEQFQTYPQ